MACRFEGSATEVRVEGVGPVKLSAGEAFSKPFAARVDLSGAHINGAGPHLLLDPAAELEPVDVDLSVGAPPYKATYRAAPDGVGATLTLTIDEGGAKGHVRGAVPKAPECAVKWCDVTWEQGAKGIAVTPAPGAGSVTVTGSFPFRKPNPADREVSSKAVSVTALGAQGKLTCDQEARAVEGETLAWHAATSGPLGVEPLVWNRGRLTLVVESGRAPHEGEGASHRSSTAGAPSKGEVNRSEDGAGSFSSTGWPPTTTAAVFLALALTALWLAKRRPGPPIAPPPPNPLLHTIRVVVAQHISDVADARRVAADAGLSLDAINFQGPAKNVWLNVFEVAEKQGRLLQLLEVVQAECPAIIDLAELINQLRATAASPGEVQH
jgi:Effector-associated domain 1